VKDKFILSDGDEKIELKIESGIPVPERISKSPIWKNIAKKMDINDSIEVRDLKSSIRIEVNLRKIGKKARRRKLANGKFRIWCIE